MIKLGKKVRVSGEIIRPVIGVIYREIFSPILFVHDTFWQFFRERESVTVCNGNRVIDLPGLSEMRVKRDL